MRVYFAEPRKDLLKLVLTLKKSHSGPFVVVKPELGILPRFLRYTLFSTYKSFQQERAPAKDFALSWLCFIACTPKIDRALKFAAPDGKRIAIACEDELSPAALAQLGPLASFADDGKWRAAAEKRLAEMYGLSRAALANYSLEDLLIEKSAVALL